MSVLLFVVGVIAVMLGVAMAAYGIPVKEFSFGNTMIIAGTTTAVGGLVVMALGVAVGFLQRIAETLAARPVRPSRPLEAFEAPAGARTATAQIPFPPRPKSETIVREPPPAMDEPAHADIPVEDHASPAPALRNPEITAVASEEYEVKEYEDVSLSPPEPMPPPVFDEPLPPPPPPRANTGPPPAAEHHAEPEPDAPEKFAPPPPPPPPPPRAPQTSNFDAMWPAESRPARRPVASEFKPEPPQAPATEPQNPELPAAILKSGVVDGMAYTLYVDGSIEAELPSGTLHFASINDLREHLAKND
ncbi:MAG: hypothetical protein ACREB2_02950 [Pseudolabrys sp.]